MSIIRSTGVVMMLLAFVLAVGVSADTVIVRNKFENNKAEVTVACYAYVDWRSVHYVEPGEEVAVAVPFNERLFGWRPSYCTGYWKYAGHVKIYRSYLDHEACKDKCVVEVRDNGSFLWNQTEKAWDLIDKLPHHHGRDPSWFAKVIGSYKSMKTHIQVDHNNWWSSIHSFFYQQ